MLFEILFFIIAGIAVVAEAAFIAETWRLRKARQRYWQMVRNAEASTVSKRITQRHIVTH